MNQTGLCGADTPVRETVGPEAVKVRPNAIVSAIVRVGEVLVATLREIFDESSYQRFLERSQLESSPNAYAVFLKENDQSRARKPRCC